MSFDSDDILRDHVSIIPLFYNFFYDLCVGI
jgi:hypothetical protein